MGNNSSARQSSANREKDYLTNKLLMVFTIAFIMILGLMIVGRMMRRVDTFLLAWNATKVIAATFAVLALVGVGIAIYSKKRGINTQYSLFSGINIAVVSAFIAVCSGGLSLVFDPSFLPVLYVFIPAVAVTYIVFHSYQREYLAVWSISAFGAIGIWIIGSALSGGYGHSHAMLFLWAFSVILALALVITVLLQMSGGIIKLGAKRRLRVFDAGMRYGIVYLSYAVVIGILAAVVFTAGALTYQLVFALVGYIVLAGIYYTIKLI